MRTRGALLLVASALLVLAGCGVPDDAGPFVDGAAPGFGGADGRTGTVSLPSPAGANTREELVQRFLRAGAAADWDPALPKDQRISRAVSLAREFMTPEAARAWVPGSVVLVVDPEPPAPSVDAVDVNMRPVGVLEETGVLSPVPQNVQQEIAAHFVVTPTGAGGQFRLSGAPPGYLLLSVDALDGAEALFDVRPVYFWDRSDRYLVPDRRYLSRGISDQKRIKTIVDRVLAGPSEFLENVTFEPPTAGTYDNPVLQGDRVIVNLPPGAIPAGPVNRMGHIVSQIRWSLHPNVYTVELQIGGREQATGSGTEYLLDNPSQPRPSQGTQNDERLYGVVDGRVVRVGTGSHPSVLDAPENSSVVSAAVNRGSDTAALVLRQGSRLELWMGRGQGQATYVRAALPPAAAISRPSYLPGGGGRVLVAVDGVLFDVAPDGSARRVPGSETMGAVRAVAVAPDGARIALVTSGAGGERAVVAALDPAGPATIDKRRDLFVGPLTQLRGIGWLYEHQLVVGGEAGLYLVAIDNGHLEDITPSNLGGAQLTQVSAVPVDPNRGVRGIMVIEANQGQAYFPYPLGLTPIAAPAPAPPPSPDASASPGITTSPPLKLSAPFYLDVG